MQRRAARLDNNVNRAIRSLLLVMDREIVTATPVDTGRARSNWLASLGAPRRDVIAPYSPYPPREGTGPAGERFNETANAQAAMEQAAAVAGQRQIGETIYLSNNLAYIQELNRGHSKQAPRMFVQRAIANAVLILRQSRYID